MVGSLQDYAPVFSYFLSPYELTTQPSLSATLLTSVWFSHHQSHSLNSYCFREYFPTRAGLWNTSAHCTASSFVRYNSLLLYIHGRPQKKRHLSTQRLHVWEHHWWADGPLANKPHTEITPAAGTGSGYLENRGDKGNIIEQTHTPAPKPPNGGLKPR